MYIQLICFQNLTINLKILFFFNDRKIKFQHKIEKKAWKKKIEEIEVREVKDINTEGINFQDDGRIN